MNRLILPDSLEDVFFLSVPLDASPKEIQKMLVANKGVRDWLDGNRRDLS